MGDTAQALACVGAVRLGRVSAYGANDVLLTELALRAKDGDRDAVQQLVLLTQRDVIRFIAHLAGPGEAEDLAQETYIRVMKALPSFEGRAPARVWLLSIARHTVLDHLRAQSRRPRAAAVDDWVTVTDAVQRSGQARFDEQILLQQLIFGLDPDRREAFVATQILGLPYDEAAQVLGCPVGTIRSRVARARDDLAAALAAGTTPTAGRSRHLRAV
jgi:RNA polymerase sigma-70 factor, ECF subfamily